MTALRHLARARLCVVALLLAAAMLARVAVPAGFMPAVGKDGTVTLAWCPGYAPVAPAATMHHGGGHQMHHDEGKRAGSPCAFADLSLPAMAGADPIQLAAALAFILAVALLLAAPAFPRAFPRQRPPTRAPPLPA